MLHSYSNSSSVFSQSPKDWIEIFPQAKTEYILPKIREMETDISTLEAAITKELKRAEHLEDAWFVREIIKANEITSLVKLKHEQNRLRRYLPQPISRGRINQNQIDRAREYPVIELAEMNLLNIKKCGRAFRSLCPYHKEKSPSFYLYSESNSGHCYGCQEHCDVIALTQHLLSLSFVEAVKYLAPTV